MKKMIYLVNYSTIQERFFLDLVHKIHRNAYEGDDQFHVFYVRDSREAMRVFGPPIGELYYRESKNLSLYYENDASKIPEDIIKCYTQYVRSNMVYGQLKPVRIVDNNWEQYVEYVKERKSNGLDIDLQTTIF